MEKDNSTEVLKLTTEEQEKLERVQMVCDKLVTEMEIQMNTDKQNRMDLSTDIEIVDGNDLEQAEITQSAMMMAKEYFRYNGYPAQVNCTSRHAEGNEQSFEFELMVRLKPESSETISEEK